MRYIKCTKCKNYVPNVMTTTCYDCDSICNYEAKRLINADRIRAMSDEELAVWLVEKTTYQESAFSSPSYLNFLTDADDTKESAIKGTFEWLRQPAEVDDHA